MINGRRRAPARRRSDLRLKGTTGLAEHAAILLPVEGERPKATPPVGAQEESIERDIMEVGSDSRGCLHPRGRPAVRVPVA